MNKLFITIIFILLTIILVGEDKSLIDLRDDNTLTINDSTNIFQPKYLEIPILKDYIINQPIREILRWNSIFMAQAVLFEVLEAPGYGMQVTGSVALVTGSSVGFLIGFWKGLIYRHRYNEGIPILFREPYLLQEQRFSDYDNKWDISNKLIFKHHILFWDEIGLNYSLTGWIGVNLHNVYEQKFQVSLTDYYHFDRNISLYYCISSGYSKGKYSDENYAILTKDLFCASGQIGLKIDFFDLFYGKLEVVKDYSPFYYHLKEKGFWVNSKSNYGIGFVFGTTIY